MDILNRELSLESFFAQLKSAKNRILMLDYDGTLSPFTPDRDNAVPYPGVSGILEEIISNGGTRLIVISGRSIDDLKRLLGMKHQPVMWGSHGAERYSPRDGYSAFEPSNTTLRALKMIKQWSVENGLEKRVEIKPFGIAYHWRGLSQDQGEKIAKLVEDEWKNRLIEYHLELRVFDGGIEIRHKKINKGTAIDEIVREYREDFVAAYAGDDQTDEDAFKALGDKGLKILVREESRPTAADIVLSPPGELLDFLIRWHETTSRN